MPVIYRGLTYQRMCVSCCGPLTTKLGALRLCRAGPRCDLNPSLSFVFSSLLFLSLKGRCMGTTASCERWGDEVEKLDLVREKDGSVSTSSILVFSLQLQRRTFNTESKKEIQTPFISVSFLLIIVGFYSTCYGSCLWLTFTSKTEVQD